MRERDSRVSSMFMSICYYLHETVIKRESGLPEERYEKERRGRCKERGERRNALERESVSRREGLRGPHIITLLCLLDILCHIIFILLYIVDMETYQDMFIWAGLIGTFGLVWDGGRDLEVSISERGYAIRGYETCKE